MPYYENDDVFQEEAGTLVKFGIVVLGVVIALICTGVYHLLK